MAVIISNNMVIGEQSGTMTGGNAPVLAYNNILNVSNVTASSALPSNPITNVANPVTAYTWESAIADYAGAVSYPDATNLMPSPFDPSGWFGASDADLSYQSVTESNPSGENFVGEFEYLGPGFGTIAASSGNSVSIGETVYSAIVAKCVNNINNGFRIRFEDGSTQLFNLYVNCSTGNSTSTTGFGTVRSTQLDDNYILIEIEYESTVTSSNFEIFFQFYEVDTFGNQSGFPDIGDKIKCQAVFFGKSDDWPALVDESGIKINVNTAGQSVDYIGIARHNLNQIGLTVTVRYNGITVVNAVPISDAQALLFLQNEAVPDNVEIIIKGATVAPQIGVIYIGKSLRLERNIYVGHTPITYGRNRKTVNGVSENGQYLGGIDVRSNNVTSVNLQNLTPTWYRSFLDPFFKLSPRIPCFWAWRPETYPDEVGYAWVEGEPNMSNQRANGMVQVSWNFKGNA